MTVRGKGKNPGVMRTQKSYSNYELEFEWRWMDGKGNSGCLIHTSTPRQLNIWPKSIEVQLMPNRREVIVDHPQAEGTVLLPAFSSPRNLAITRLMLS